MDSSSGDEDIAMPGICPASCCGTPRSEALSCVSCGHQRNPVSDCCEASQASNAQLGSGKNVESTQGDPNHSQSGSGENCGGIANSCCDGSLKPSWAGKGQAWNVEGARWHCACSFSTGKFNSPEEPCGYQERGHQLSGAQTWSPMERQERRVQCSHRSKHSSCSVLTRDSFGQSSESTYSSLGLDCSCCSGHSKAQGSSSPAVASAALNEPSNDQVKRRQGAPQLVQNHTQYPGMASSASGSEFVSMNVEASTHTSKFGMRSQQRLSSPRVGCKGPSQGMTSSSGSCAPELKGKKKHRRSIVAKPRHRRLYSQPLLLLRGKCEPGQGHQYHRSDLKAPNKQSPQACTWEGDRVSTAQGNAHGWRSKSATVGVGGQGNLEGFLLTRRGQAITRTSSQERGICSNPSGETEFSLSTQEGSLLHKETCFESNQTKYDSSWRGWTADFATCCADATGAEETSRARAALGRGTPLQASSSAAAMDAWMEEQVTSQQAEARATEIGGAGLHSMTWQCLTGSSGTSAGDCGLEGPSHPTRGSELGASHPTRGSDLGASGICFPGGDAGLWSREERDGDGGLSRVSSGDESMLADSHFGSLLFDTDELDWDWPPVDGEDGNGASSFSGEKGVESESSQDEITQGSRNCGKEDDAVSGRQPCNAVGRADSPWFMGFEQSVLEVPRIQPGSGEQRFMGRTGHGQDAGSIMGVSCRSPSGSVRILESPRPSFRGLSARHEQQSGALASPKEHVKALGEEQKYVLAGEQAGHPNSCCAGACEGLKGLVTAEAPHCGPISQRSLPSDVRMLVGSSGCDTGISGHWNDPPLQGWRAIIGRSCTSGRDGPNTQSKQTVHQGDAGNSCLHGSHSGNSWRMKDKVGAGDKATISCFHGAHKQQPVACSTPSLDPDEDRTRPSPATREMQQLQAAPSADWGLEAGVAPGSQLEIVPHGEVEGSRISTLGGCGSLLVRQRQPDSRLLPKLQEPHSHDMGPEAAVACRCPKERHEQLPGWSLLDPWPLKTLLALVSLVPLGGGLRPTNNCWPPPRGSPLYPVLMLLGLSGGLEVCTLFAPLPLPRPPEWELGRRAQRQALRPPLHAQSPATGLLWQCLRKCRWFVRLVSAAVLAIHAGGWVAKLVLGRISSYCKNWPQDFDDA